MENPSKLLFENLRNSGKTLAFAESITAGNLSAEIVRYPGASDVLLGGIVAYANEVKQGVLSVKKETLLSQGAVSEETVREMALGLYKQIPADFCVAVSGIAGPGGGSDEKPVGTVWLAIRHLDRITAFRHVFKGSREEIIRACIDWVYQSILVLEQE